MSETLKTYIKKTWKVNIIRLLHILVMFAFIYYVKNYFEAYLLALMTTALSIMFHILMIRLELLMFIDLAYLRQIEERLNVNSAVNDYVRRTRCVRLYVSRYVYDLIESEEYDNEEYVEDSYCDIVVDPRRDGISYGGCRIDEVINNFEELE